MENIKADGESRPDEKCERCGSPLVIKWGKQRVSFYACSSYDKRKIRRAATSRKRNPINLPDLDSADIQETTQEGILRKNCGRVMVLKRGPLWAVPWLAPDIPIAKNYSPVGSGQKKVPDIPLDEKMPEMLGPQHDDPPRGVTGSSLPAAGYPECKVREAEFSLE